MTKQAETQKRYEERQRKAGMIRKCVWVHKQDTAKFDRLVRWFLDQATGGKDVEVPD